MIIKTIDNKNLQTRDVRNYAFECIGDIPNIEGWNLVAKSFEGKTIGKIGPFEYYEDAFDFMMFLHYETWNSNKNYKPILNIKNDDKFGMPFVRYKLNSHRTEFRRFEGREPIFIKADLKKGDSAEALYDDLKTIFSDGEGDSE